MLKNLPASEGDKKRHGFDPWVKKIPWGRKQQPTPIFLPAKLHGQRSLAGHRTDPPTITTSEFQKEKDVILKCSIYVPVNTDVCREQDAITGCAKGIKYIIYNPSLKNFLRRVWKLSNKTQLRACQPYRTLGEQ